MQYENVPAAKPAAETDDYVKEFCQKYTIHPKPKIAALFYRTQFRRSERESTSKQMKSKKDQGKDRGKGAGRGKKGTFTITLKNNKWSLDDTEPVDTKKDPPAIWSRDEGLFGRRKPVFVFVKQAPGKRNPPLEGKLVTAARYRYDQAKIELFPQARFEWAKLHGIERNELKLPIDKYKILTTRIRKLSSD